MSTARDLPRFVLIGALLGVGLGVALQAGAGDGAEVRLPYRGFLTLDGQPAEGERAVTFRLHTGPDCNDCAVWSETQPVQLIGGRFGVSLGAVTPLADVAADAERLWLSLEVDGVALSGRQAIESVPHAVRTTGGSRLDVRGGLGLSGPATGVAAINPGGETVAFADGLAITQSLDLQGARLAEVGPAGGRPLVLDSGDIGLTYAGGLQLTDLRADELNVFDPSVVNGDLRVSGDAGGARTVNGFRLVGTQRIDDVRGVGFHPTRFEIGQRNRARFVFSGTTMTHQGGLLVGDLFVSEGALRSTVAPKVEVADGDCRGALVTAVRITAAGVVTVRCTATVN